MIRALRLPRITSKSGVYHVRLHKAQPVGSYLNPSQAEMSSHARSGPTTAAKRSTGDEILTLDEEPAAQLGVGAAAISSSTKASCGNNTDELLGHHDSDADSTDEARDGGADKRAEGESFALRAMMRVCVSGC